MIRAAAFRQRSLALIPLLCLAAIADANAQTSASFKLAEATFNSGGNPRDGVPLASSQFRVSLDSIGDGLTPAALSSASFHVDAGFVGRYMPPGEVSDLQFSDASTVVWAAEPSAGEYELYRDLASTLPGSFGLCLAADLATPLVTEATTPLVGQAFFYLVTARNRLGEEGPKGYGSNGSPEGNPAPCP